MQISTIKFSQIEDRVDAEYYKPEFLMGEKLILDREWQYLGNLAKSIQYGTTPEEGFFVEKGIPFIRSQNFSLGEFRYDDLVKCTPEFHQGHQRSRVLPKDILIAAVGGTIGEVGIVPDDVKKGNINQNIARVRLKDRGLAYFIAFFLGSKFGQNQLFRYATRTTQGYLNTDQIKSIKIPIPSQSFQQKIEKMVKEAERKRKLADEKYKEAEEILNKKLGLEYLDLSTQKIFEAKFSEAEDRFDPEYYQPKYKKIISKLKSQKSKLLGRVVRISDKKIDSTKNPSAEIKYIELANINGSNGIIEDCETYKHWQLPGRARMLIRSDDVLVSSLGGSIDKVGLVTEEYDNQVASTGFFVINSDVLNSETLFLIFRNKVITNQLERNTRGAIMSAISANEFENILVPIIPKSTQQKISSLIQESFKLRQEAKELIDGAKKEVEAMVEGN